jgi:2-haloacid dehalogenase
MLPADIKALTFDIFGTVVDWRGTIIEEGRQFNRRKGMNIDWAAFADAWRAEYGPSMDRVRRGEMGWTKLHDLHKMNLYKVIHDFGIVNINEEEIEHLNHVWHRLRPWPDSVEGLTRLKKEFIIATLSNGNVGMLVNMAKHSGLPWDCILSAELMRQYKPSPAVYRLAVDLLDLEPTQVLMVAAHARDLQAAAAVGLRTAFVSRPTEYGAGHDPEAETDTSKFDFAAKDFNDLADQLGVSR